MKYIMTLIWGFILGQVTYYLGTALKSGVYDAKSAFIMSLCAIVVVFILQLFIPLKKDSNHHSDVAQ